MTRKSIVLSDVEKTNKKAVLTMEEKDGKVVGSLRLYNFSKDVDGIISLGIYYDDIVTKCGLTKKQNMFYEFFTNLKTIPQKFSCAVVNISNASAKPLLFGSSQGETEQIYGQIIEELKQKNTYQNTKNVLDRYEIDFEENEKQEIEKEIDKCFCEEKCENCAYKKHFIEEQKSKQNDKKLTPNSNIEQKNTEKQDFFENMKPQIEKILNKNPIEENLQNIFPKSKWVKVDYEEEGDYYVFGIVYDESDNAKFVCYGVPAIFEETPPQELTGYPFFVPLSEEKSDGFGYWITFQDAETGDAVDVSN